MKLSDEIRLLEKKWEGKAGWPKFLQWVEINGLRGWAGQRVNFEFPIVAIVGENGSGKSTILQAVTAAHSTDNKKDIRYPAEFFPPTHWDSVTGITIKYGFKQGPDIIEGQSIRKRTTRWLGYEARPKRVVEYIDLSRLQPVGARVGYARIAKNKHIEISAKLFEAKQVEWLSNVMAKVYQSAKMAISSVGKKHPVPVVERKDSQRDFSYSGFHSGAGETTITELLARIDAPATSLILIDEIESSLHPRAQRRLIRLLAKICRDKDVQIIITTHSPYILEELPPKARICLLDVMEKKEIISGVSSEFAMTQMDDEQHPECDLYVEDEAAKVMLGEILSKYGANVLPRCCIIPYGTANVGKSLGQMVANNRFREMSLVFLDGDSDASDGCILLPGGDAPEQVVFKNLKQKNWGKNLWIRLGRAVGDVSEACSKAMTLANHHDWIKNAATQLGCSTETLWHAMCLEWVEECLAEDDAKKILDHVQRVLP